jgi:hypothetical protein
MNPTLTPKAVALLRQVEIKAMSPEDAALAKKYPRHTLEEARKIDATRGHGGTGIRSGFEFLQWQEHGNSYSFH